MPDNWISVYNTTKLYDAELVKEILTNNEIDAVVVNRKDSTYIIFGEIEVHVRVENEAKAIELIRELKVDSYN